MEPKESASGRGPAPANGNGQPWTAREAAALVLLFITAGVLIWNVYQPEDIYLSDLPYEVMESDLYDPRNDQSVDGRPLQIHKSYYPKGIGTHARSVIFVRFVPANHTHFTAEVGIDAGRGPESGASAVFRVSAGGSEARAGTEGALLYESPVMRPGMNPRLVHVPVRGRRSLTLEVTDAGDGNGGDAANWAMARFTKE